MGRVADFFEKHGVSKKDIPMAIIGFKAENYLVFAATFAFCVGYRPSFRLSRSKRIKRIRANTPWIDRYSTQMGEFVARNAKKAAEYRMFRYMSEKIGVKPQQFVMALPESMLLYKLTIPIHWPLQLYVLLTYFSKKSSIDSFADLDDAASELSELDLDSYDPTSDRRTPANATPSASSTSPAARSSPSPSSASSSRSSPSTDLVSRSVTSLQQGSSVSPSNGDGSSHAFQASVAASLTSAQLCSSKAQVRANTRVYSANAQYLNHVEVESHASRITPLMSVSYVSPYFGVSNLGHLLLSEMSSTQWWRR